MESSPAKAIMRERDHRSSSDQIADASSTFVNMPPDIIDHIFCLLPIQDAIHASTVAKRFRRIWQYNRVLEFDQELARRFMPAYLVLIIDRIFTLHMGPNIRSFKMYFFDPETYEHLVKNWIRTSISKGLEELDLDFIYSMRFTLTPDCLDARNLRFLRLCGCAAEISPNPTGLRFLTTLILKRVRTTQRVIETMIDTCIHLETLKISHCQEIIELQIRACNLAKFKLLKIKSCVDLTHIGIDAPALRTFYYLGDMPTFLFIDLSSLEMATIWLRPPKGYLRHQLMKEFWLRLATVERLTVTSVFLEGLTPSFKNGRLTPFNFVLPNLTKFELWMQGATYCNSHDIVSFLTKCPNVEDVFIDFRGCSFEESVFWEVHQKRDVDYFRVLRRLKTVKLQRFQFRPHYMDLATIFLDKAINLESLVLMPKPSPGPSKPTPPYRQMYTDFVCAMRNSTRAEIVLHDPVTKRQYSSKPLDS